ncbi:hypothetical protein ACFPAF_00325 [Hymenobacter endophyticus]|uniref:DUF4129 domain-containing protein n=1 Tax=Hymenobacter endophyticus TaxID=3076335 RepID=A0ABU3TBS7_9BACT|nr:hypothetical protein [Hymenobacter endophyticus]MDU0368823.1 hypothetical protein [Hymenobacter endophyticus]
MIPGLGLLLALVSRRQRNRADENHLRRELLAHQRRQLLHAQLPDLGTARRAFGPRFDSLHQLLVRHDLAGLGPDAPASPLYPELARTLLYRLPKATTPGQRLGLLQQEVYLWFGREVRLPEPDDALTQAFEAWQQSELDQANQAARL